LLKGRPEKGQQSEIFRLYFLFSFVPSYTIKHNTYKAYTQYKTKTCLAHARKKEEVFLRDSARYLSVCSPDNGRPNGENIVFLARSLVEKKSN
jgi:hypothetical protein